MSVLGMGPLEIIVILLIAFIVLGPQRMVDAARLMGKGLRELRQFADDLPSLSLDEDEAGTPASPIVHRGGGPRPVEEARNLLSRTQADSADAAKPGNADHADTRVSFRRDAGRDGSDPEATLGNEASPGKADQP